MKPTLPAGGEVCLCVHMTLLTDVIAVAPLHILDDLAQHHILPLKDLDALLHLDGLLVRVEALLLQILDV